MAKASQTTKLKQWPLWGLVFCRMKETGSTEQGGEEEGLACRSTGLEGCGWEKQ